jgi:hypothetical protein
MFKKVIDNETFKRYKGKNFPESWYIHIIDTDKDGYCEESGKILFKFRKNVIPTKLQNLAIDVWAGMSSKKHANRGMASGLFDDGNARKLSKTGHSEAKYVCSNISGYIDRPLREHLGKLGFS